MPAPSCTLSSLTTFIVVAHSGQPFREAVVSTRPTRQSARENGAFRPFTTPHHPDQHGLPERLPGTRRGTTGPRTVYLNRDAKAPIARQPRLESAHVFPSVRDPRRPCSERSLRNFWYMARKRVGLGDVRLHDLRHIHASQAVMTGVPLPVVSKLVGRRQAGMMLRYAYVADRELKAAAERVGQAIARMCGFPGS